MPTGIIIEPYGLEAAILDLKPVMFVPMNEGLTGTARDLVSRRDATWSGTTALAAPLFGQSGWSHRFNGSNVELTFPVSTVLHPADTQSMFFLFKKGTNGARMFVCASGTNDMCFRWESTNEPTLRKDGVSALFVPSSTDTDTTNPHTWLAWKNSFTSAGIYRDGVALAGTFTDDPLSASTSAFTIGSDQATADTFFLNGDLSHFALFNRVLTQTEARYLDSIARGN